MWKFTKMLIGIGLLPLAWAVSAAVYTLYKSSLDTELTSGWDAWALPAGFLIWAALFFLLPRPFRTYVLGHELTHALSAVLMGGRVGQIKVGKDGGHVELSKTNFIITLAPYFFPFYTFLIIGAYYLAGIRFNVEPYMSWWLGAVGLTWSFHLTFTLFMLSQRQPDVQEQGRIFSYTLIYIMNILLIGVWMTLIGSPHFSELGQLLKEEIVSVYGWVRDWVQTGILYFGNPAEPA